MALTPRLKVGANLVGWGQLIKSWATDLDYVGQPVTAQPPRTAWVNLTWNHPAGATPGPANVSSVGMQWALPATAPIAVNGPSGAHILPRAVALTTAEFYALMTAAGVTATEQPAQYSHVIVVQGDAATMVIRLPPRDTLQGSEDDLIAGIPYPLEPFYHALYNGGTFSVPTMPPTRTDPTEPVRRGAIMTLHANRIGEYTLNNCN